MKDVKTIRVNLQETILIVDESITRVDTVIAMYSNHTNIITIRDSWWNSIDDIETHFVDKLSIEKAPVITSCSGFGIECI